MLTERYSDLRQWEMAVGEWEDESNMKDYTLLPDSKLENYVLPVFSELNNRQFVIKPYRQYIPTILQFRTCAVITNAYS